MEPELFKNWEKALKSNGKIGLRRILRAYNIIFTHRGGKTLKLLVEGLFERETYHSCCMNLGYLIYPCDLRWWKDDDSSRKAFPTASLAQNSTSTSAVSFRIRAYWIVRIGFLCGPSVSCAEAQEWPEVSNWSANSMAKNGRLEGWKDDQSWPITCLITSLISLGCESWPRSEFHYVILGSNPFDPF